MDAVNRTAAETAAEGAVETGAEEVVETAADKAVEKIARTCLYEGYLLWPYSRSALKNTRRWTFGGVYPRTTADALGEPCRMQTQCLLQGEPDADLTVRVRFLHVVDRTVLQEGPHAPRPVDSMTVQGRRYLTWQEATERDLRLPSTTAAELLALPRAIRVAVPAGSDREPIHDEQGRQVGALLRTWKPLTGIVRLEAVPVADRTVRLTVRITNTTPCLQPEPDARDARDRAAPFAFVSTHAVLHSDRGAFVSLTDPPAHLRQAVRECDNQGTWPVLVGDEGGHTMLSSPITLSDYPQVAPESPGDMFDGTEIDQLLVLSVLSMTDEEREEMAAADPRGRDILERCTALTAGEMSALHGTIRGFRPLEDA
ncbi:hypothetical protein ABT009_33195 [Streptomyces sp. NPDC002896]|uniref:hypothetical protein n=1 Tax=Streptomyces sp. NPDC002896 TaxID=3154438 RepID=UPI00332DA7E9